MNNYERYDKFFERWDWARAHGAANDRLGRKLQRGLALLPHDVLFRQLAETRIRQLKQMSKAGLLPPFTQAQLFDGELVLGQDLHGHPIRIMLDWLCSGLFTVANTGSGKSNLAYWLVSQLAWLACSTWLIEPYKIQFRLLLPIYQRAGKPLIILPWQNWRWNLLQCEGVDPRSHATSAAELLVRTLDIPGRAAVILRQGIHVLYTKYSVWNGDATRLPGFLDLAGSQLRKPDQSLRVVLVGSPFYIGDNGAFDEHDAYPSDANLTSDEGSSPFSTVSRKKSLLGVTVHYAYLRDGFVNDYHKDRLCRFNVLFLKEQSGCLATFAADASLAFQRAVENIQQPVQTAEIDSNDTKLEMRHVRPRSIPNWFAPTNTPTASTTTNPVAVGVAAESPPAVTPTAPTTVATSNTVAVAPPVNFPVPAKDNIVGIGLMWSAPVDIDLHVLPNKDAKELYFGRSTTKEGKYFQDYRNANDGLDYEYTELKAPVDIRQVSAWANYYGGSAGPVKGKVIVYYEGKTYYGEFALTARNGNRCNETNTRDSSQYWTRIDLTKIVGLGN